MPAKRELTPEDKDKILRECRFATGVGNDGETVAERVLKAVLKAIHQVGHGGRRQSYPSYQTLADMAGVTRGQAMRAVQALGGRTTEEMDAVRMIRAKRKYKPLLGPAIEGYGVLAKEPGWLSGPSSNVYAIDWGRLEEKHVRSSQPLFHQQAGIKRVVKGQPVPATWSRDGTTPVSSRDQGSPVTGLPQYRDGTLPPDLASYELPIEPPPPPPSDDGWEEVVEKFRGRKIGEGDAIGTLAELAACYRERRLTSAEFERDLTEAIATALITENAGKLSSPAGAVDWFLRRGSWPCTGIVSLAEHDERLRLRVDAEARERAAAGAAHKRAAATAAEAIDHEQRYGPALDAMSEADLLTLLAHATDFERKAIRKLGVRPGTSGRLLAIKLMHAREKRDEPP